VTGKVVPIRPTAEMRTDLLARQDDGVWPANPRTLAPGDLIALDSIRCAAPLIALSRSAYAGA
jgi:hypothetical protein